MPDSIARQYRRRGSHQHALAVFAPASIENRVAVGRDRGTAGRGVRGDAVSPVQTAAALTYGSSLIGPRFRIRVNP